MARKIEFNDGAGYERMMGRWSRIAGATFLDWLAPPHDARWIDIGCGNGAFTELIFEQCQPAAVIGIDPSEGQLAYARQRPGARLARFELGNGMALPPVAQSGAFDVATMALVLFFLDDPARGVAEMARVLAPGGIAGAYAWDILGGGFPLEPIQAEIAAMGIAPLRPPSADASRIEVMASLWTNAGFRDVETREIVAHRTFTDFDEFWSVANDGTSVKATLADMAPPDVEALRERVRRKLGAEPGRPLTTSARANAVKGRLPA